MAYLPHIDWHSAGDALRSHPYATIAATLLLLPLLVLVSDYVDGWRRRSSLGGIPIVDEGSCMSPRLRRKQASFDLEDELRRAYNLYSKQGKPFAVRAPNSEYVFILPPETSKTWRNLPSDHLNFMHLVSELNGIVRHTHITSRVPIDTILMCGSKHVYLEKFHDLAVKEADRCIPSAFAMLEDEGLHEFNTASIGYSITAEVVISFIMGPEFSKDKELVRLLMSYIEQTNGFSYVYLGYPRILRPFLERFSGPCCALRSTILALKQRLIPEIQRRIRAARSGQKPTDFLFLDALIDQTFEKGILSREKECAGEEKDVDLLAQETMFLFFEAAGPILPVLTVMQYQIMATPEYVSPLREEITKALDTHAGEWTYGIFKRTPKLESFTREALRLHGPIIFSISRRVMKPLKLDSVDLDLQPGAFIATPARFIHTDPDIYPDPMTFNGYRFYDAASNSCSPQMLTTSDTFLAFGQGSGLCPGRALGIIPTHIIFAKMLMSYDIKFAGGRKEYPRSTFSDGNNIFDSTVRMHVRKRQKAD